MDQMALTINHYVAIVSISNREKIWEYAIGGQTSDEVRRSDLALLIQDVYNAKGFFFYCGYFIFRS